MFSRTTLIIRQNYTDWKHRRNSLIHIHETPGKVIGSHQKNNRILFYIYTKEIWNLYHQMATNMLNTGSVLPYQERTVVSLVQMQVEDESGRYDVHSHQDTVKEQRYLLSIEN